MKVKIKEYFGELPDYLTPCKTYEFTKLKDYCGLVTVDNDLEYFTYLTGTHHLNGGSWEVVNE